MRKDVFDRLLALQAARRSVLKGTAALGAAAALGGLGGWPLRRALAQSDLRTQILQIPGVNMGSPTDADWQQVGELCLDATKANVAEGEFAGRRTDLHGAQQPEPAQLPVSRLPQAVGAVHRR